MIKAIQLIGKEVAEHWKLLLLRGFLFALFFQIFMLIALVVRFQSLPNYINLYDWIGNVVHIVQSTPSVTDTVGIVTEEWLIEIGQMSYDYGTGLSIWSLNVMPSRVLVLTFMGCLITLCALLLKRKNCSATGRRSAVLTVSAGSVMVAMTNATMSWVVCCASPTWVVGLAMLGLGVSTSLALESMGPALSVGGFVLLVATCLILAWKKTQYSASLIGNLDHA
ncbi:MAG: hypothetical protein AB8B97_12490 [Granulosicoccus sp.]